MREPIDFAGAFLVEHIEQRPESKPLVAVEGQLELHLSLALVSGLGQIERTVVAHGAHPELARGIVDVLEDAESSLRAVEHVSKARRLAQRLTALVAVRGRRALHEVRTCLLAALEAEQRPSRRPECSRIVRIVFDCLLGVRERAIEATTPQQLGGVGDALGGPRLRRSPQSLGDLGQKIALLGEHGRLRVQPQPERRLELTDTVRHRAQAPDHTLLPRAHRFQ